MKKKTYSLDALPTLALFVIFVLAAAAMLLGGLRVYQKTERRLAENFDAQVPLSYLAAKVRQSDGAPRVTVFDDGTLALALDAQLEGETYTTRLYVREGALWELFTPADTVLSPADGVRLTEAGAMAFSWQSAESSGPLLRVDYTDPAGGTETLLLSPRKTAGGS